MFDVLVGYMMYVHLPQCFHSLMPFLSGHICYGAAGLYSADTSDHFTNTILLFVA